MSKAFLFVLATCMFLVMLPAAAQGPFERFRGQPGTSIYCRGYCGGYGMVASRGSVRIPGIETFIEVGTMVDRRSGPYEFCQTNPCQQ